MSAPTFEHVVAEGKHEFKLDVHDVDDPTTLKPEFLRRKLAVLVVDEELASMDLPPDAFTRDAYATLDPKSHVLTVCVPQKDPHAPAMVEKELLDPDFPHPRVLDVVRPDGRPLPPSKAAANMPAVPDLDESGNAQVNKLASDVADMVVIHSEALEPGATPKVGVLGAHEVEPGMIATTAESRGAQEVHSTLKPPGRHHPVAENEAGDLPLGDDNDNDCCPICDCVPCQCDKMEQAYNFEMSAPENKHDNLRNKGRHWDKRGTSRDSAHHVATIRKHGDWKGNVHMGEPDEEHAGHLLHEKPRSDPGPYVDSHHLMHNVTSQNEDKLRKEGLGDVPGEGKSAVGFAPEEASEEVHGGRHSGPGVSGHGSTGGSKKQWRAAHNPPPDPAHTPAAHNNVYTGGETHQSGKPFLG